MTSAGNGAEHAGGVEGGASDDGARTTTLHDDDSVTYDGPATDLDPMTDLDPVTDMVAEAIGEILLGARVEVLYERNGSFEPAAQPSTPVPSPAYAAGEPTSFPAVSLAEALASAVGEGPSGRRVMLRVRLLSRSIPNSGRGGALLREMLRRLPDAGIRTAAEFRPIQSALSTTGIGVPALRRAIRDTVAAQVLTDLMNDRFHRDIRPGLIAETIDYLVELGGTRVEANDLTHGIVITDALIDQPRLSFEYPADVRSAKRAPLLFDGYRSMLVVDPDGRARTELQRHRLNKLDLSSNAPGVLGAPGDSGAAPIDSGSSGTGQPSSGIRPFSESCRSSAFSDGEQTMAAQATRRLGGLALVLEADRTIRAFIDGEPLLVRRGEHWTSFPLELGSVIGAMIQGGASADLVVDTALAISGGRHGAIIAVVAGSESLDGIVSLKDRYDLRDEIDPHAMRVETRLHHLIDADPLDAPTLTRLAMLDGATIIDRDANLIAYGAIVASRDSQNEGARTAAAKTLSTRADVVLRVSSDGDITIFRAGFAVTTLLGNPNQSEEQHVSPTVSLVEPSRG